MYLDSLVIFLNKNRPYYYNYSLGNNVMECVKPGE